MDETTAVTTAPETAAATAAPAAPDAVRVGERISDRFTETDFETEAAPAPIEEPVAPEQPEHSPDYEAGFEAALEQLADYDRYEAEVRQREAVYEQLGEQVGMTGPQVQQLMEEQARAQIVTQQQRAVESAELQQRQAVLYEERQAILDSAFARIAETVGPFDADDAWAEAQQLIAENPAVIAEHGDRAMEAILHAAAERSADEIARGNARIDELIGRANRVIGADPEAVREAATRAFDPSAPDRGTELARAIEEGFRSNPTPVRFGQRITDVYAEMGRLHSELADTPAQPRPERRVQLRDSGQVRDAHGRFITAERVTDRYRREAAEADAEQRRLAAHQTLMRSKGLL